MPITLDFHSAQVYSSGRLLEVIFTSETDPSDFGAFVDRHRSLADQITLTGSKSRSSVKFAGCSVSRGQSDAYLWNSIDSSYATTTKGETLSVYSGETLLGTVGPTADKDTILDGFQALFEGIPIDERSRADCWFLRTDPAFTTANMDPVTYKLRVTGPDGQSLLTEAINYVDPEAGTVNAEAAVNALRDLLQADCVTGRHRNAAGFRNVDIIFDRDRSPFWPISLALEDVSDTSLFQSLERDSMDFNANGRNNQSFAFYALNGLGCRDLDLSVVSDNAESPLNGGLLRVMEGDSRYRWTAFWYIHDPAEVVTFGETLTVSGPAGLLAGSKLDDAKAIVASGDTTAVFAAKAVTNRSWSGTDGMPSKDLCHVTDEANSVDDGWGRWQREAPPAGWINNADAPIFIFYVDPDNGTRAASTSSDPGSARANDPSHPYNTAQQANLDAQQVPADKPRLILFRQGTKDTQAAVTSFENPANWYGPSYDSPLIVSTYWLDADGDPPTDPDRLDGNGNPMPKATTINGYIWISNRPQSQRPYRNILLTGLVLEGAITCRQNSVDFAIWDCVAPPHPDSSTYFDPYDCGGLMVRFSLIRSAVYDHWSSGTANISGLHGTTFNDFLIDQVIAIRNGYRAMSDGWDGGPKSYMSLLGGDVMADLPAPYMNNFTHNFYIGDGPTTPIRIFNTYSIQGSFTSIDARPGAVVYGCCHYLEGLGGGIIGDHCHGRAGGSHVRRNLHSRLRIGNGARSWSWMMNTVDGLSCLCSLANVFEDNIFLEPETTGGNPKGLTTYDLGSLSTPYAIVVRQNTFWDQNGVQIFHGTAGATVPPHLKFGVTRNLFVRSSDEPNPNFRLIGFVSIGPWDGIGIDRNLYAVPNAVNEFAPTSSGTAASYATWQAAGLDTNSHYQTDGLTIAGDRPSGGIDVFVGHLSAASDSITDAASAITALRNRLPGTWDDDLYTPLGKSGGVIALAESAYQPTSIAVSPDADDDASYFGAIDYLGSTPPPAQVLVARRPPILIPGQFGRFGRY